MALEKAFITPEGKGPIPVLFNPTQYGLDKGNQIAEIGGRGTVGLSDCTFVVWDRAREGRHAIHADGGTVLVRGCEFRHNAPQVFLGEGVRKAIISENVMAGAVRVTDESRGQTVIEGNVGDE